MSDNEEERIFEFDEDGIDSWNKTPKNGYVESCKKYHINKYGKDVMLNKEYNTNNVTETTNFYDDYMIVKCEKSDFPYDLEKTMFSNYYNSYEHMSKTHVRLITKFAIDEKTLDKILNLKKLLKGENYRYYGINDEMVDIYSITWSYLKYTDDFYDSDDDKEEIIIFKSKINENYFIVESADLYNECGSCDGTTISLLYLYVIRDITMLKKYILNKISEAHSEENLKIFFKLDEIFPNITQFKFNIFDINFNIFDINFIYI